MTDVRRRRLLFGVLQTTVLVAALGLHVFLTKLPVDGRAKASFQWDPEQWVQLAALVVALAVADRVRLDYRTADGGRAVLSLSVYLWAIMLVLVAPGPGLVAIPLGIALSGMIGLREAPVASRYLTSAIAYTLYLTFTSGLPSDLAGDLASSDAPLIWMSAVVAMAVAQLAQLGLSTLSGRIRNGDDRLTLPREVVVSTTAMVIVMAVFGVVTAEMADRGGAAFLLMGVVVGTLVAMVRLAEGRFAVVAKLEQEILSKDHLSRHDRLTNLPNRSEFTARLDALFEAATPGARYAVLVLDLTQFRDVNEVLGHDAGNGLLIEVARRLQEVSGPEGLVARFGGDEFAILVEDVDGEAAAGRAATELLDAIERPHDEGGLLLATGASIGIVLSPEHGHDAQILLRKAEAAMYTAKDRGMLLAVHHEGDEDEAPRRLRLVGDLRLAIEAADLEVHYQPKLELASGRITGVEALARWTNGAEGSVSPSEFIPVAERTGLILELTRQVVARALNDVAEWDRQGVSLGVAINISPRILTDPGIAEELAAGILRNGLTADRVTLEVTESVVLSDSARITDTLRRLEEIGVRLSIDDYGTGYSSLSYLRQLRVDELKVDKTFVTDMVNDDNDHVLVESTIMLGHALGLKVVAEGVEDAQTLERLERLGCDMIQGWHVARPMPAGDLLQFVLSRDRNASIAR